MDAVVTVIGPCLVLGPCCVLSLEVAAIAGLVLGVSLVWVWIHGISGSEPGMWLGVVARHGSVAGGTNTRVNIVYD